VVVIEEQPVTTTATVESDLVPRSHFPILPDRGFPMLADMDAGFRAHQKREDAF
jgi:hypothetical protein